MVQTHDGSELEKSDTGWVPLAVTGLVLILLAGFDIGVCIPQNLCRLLEMMMKHHEPIETEPHGP